MRDNTTTSLHRGPTGTDERTRTVESARMAVDAVDLHRHADPNGRTGGRPAHTAGLFLRGRLIAAKGSDPFTSPVFGKNTEDPQVTVRLSPMISAAKDRRFDLHGIAVRIKPQGNAADLTDLVALNTHPFMFRSADDFATFLARTQQGARQAAIGLGAFGLAAIAGNASVQAMANTVMAMARAKQPLPGLSYWGIHTFFADREGPSDKGTVRVPYRYRLKIRESGVGTDTDSPATVLGRYRDVAATVGTNTPLVIDLWFMLPWRWKRLVDWRNVPRNIREQIINPTVDWRHVTRIHMATLVLDEVLDTSAFEGSRTAAEYDSLMFDPTRLSTGLYPSEDPLLRARSGVYAESHMRRR